MLNTHLLENAKARTKQQYYEHGDKSGKLLAWQIQKEDSLRCIPSIKIKDSATVVHDPKLINEAFKDFYLDLYSSLCVDTRKINDFLERLAIPGMTAKTQDSLEADVTTQEVLNAIQRLSRGKSAGQDGFPMDFYKAFASSLITPLMDMFKHATEIHQLPKTLEQALITVLLKPGKDPKLCGSYRPVALLSSEYKVFTNVIATRLENVIPSLINEDQTGFIQNCFSSDNIRIFIVLIVPKI